MSLRDKTKAHEGFRESPYLDTKGLWTVGIGRCLQTNPLTSSEWAHLLSHKLIELKITEDGAEWLMDTQLYECRLTLYGRFKWFEDLNDVRKDILTEMYYQMGASFFTFEDMLESLSVGDYARAARHGLDSKWARKDSPRRAREMMATLERGS